MEDQEQKEDKAPSKWVSMGKMLTGAAALVTALVMAFSAMMESKGKTSEAVSKASHETVVKQLEALNKDLEDMDKLTTARLDKLKNSVASANTVAASAQAMFSGFMAGRRGAGVGGVGVAVSPKLSLKKPRAKTKKPSVPQLKSPRRSYRKPKSWNQIQPK